MWLLDVNVPKQLVAVLAELGEESQTAIARGWGQLTNGDLVDAAFSSGFSCILTRDPYSVNPPHVL